MARVEDPSSSSSSAAPSPGYVSRPDAAAPSPPAHYRLPPRNNAQSHRHSYQNYSSYQQYQTHHQNHPNHPNHDHYYQFIHPPPPPHQRQSYQVPPSPLSPLSQQQHYQHQQPHFYQQQQQQIESLQQQQQRHQPQSFYRQELQSPQPSPPPPPPPPAPASHQRSRSSVLRSILHRRNASNGAPAPPPLSIDNNKNSSNSSLSSPYYPVSAGGPIGGYASPQSSPGMMFSAHHTGRLGGGGGGGGGALGELPQNNQDGPSRRSSPQKTREARADPDEPRSRSPTKVGLGTFGGIWSREKENSSSRGRDESPTRPKKTKSATNLTALLSRPKSSRNLAKLAADQDRAAAKDRETISPTGPDAKPDSRAATAAVDLPSSPPPPIYAQFCSDAASAGRQAEAETRAGGNSLSSDTHSEKSSDSLEMIRRYIPGTRSANPSLTNLRSKVMAEQQPQQQPAGPPARASRPQTGTKVLSAIAALGQAATRSRPAAVGGSGGSSSNGGAGGAGGSGAGEPGDPTAPTIDPKDIDRHLEEMLDRRNIPENQRYKMRNLNKTIKTEFIRQDWAEMSSAAGRNGGERPRTIDSSSSAEMAAATAAALAAAASAAAIASGSGSGSAAATAGPEKEDRDIGRDREKDKDKDKAKRNRGKSFTLGRSNKDKDSAGSSPTKKGKSDTSLGRHFRTKSTESLAAAGGDRPLSLIESGAAGQGLFSKIKLQQGPADFVAYLRKVQKPQLVEVGKLHKLRLLLRNETVSWTEEFIQQGGMREIVGLLNRIMEVEWREEHEDALLHENLLCLKALCTTALALQYLHSIQADLFPKLLHMLFDPDRKGPSEFTTRNIITSVLFTYIRTAGTAPERESRARTMLSHLRDPTPREDERPVGFVLDMRRERPYRIWCRETTSVTKEVFWIFLHHLNIVALSSSSPSDRPSTSSEQQPAPQQQPQSTPGGDPYMSRHFPQERSPVPAAPYVGGVEWDATNYLASHLDLLNAIIACTSGVGARNALRAELRISGWERCMGGSLRLCKEKFYGSVHDGLRTWVAAAAEDGWDVRDVRYGPPPPEPPPKPAAAAPAPASGAGASPKKPTAGQKLGPPPRIEMPRLSIGLDTPAIRTPTGQPPRGGGGGGGGGGDQWLS